MPFGGSDGKYYDDHLDYLMNSSMPAQPLPEGIKRVIIGPKGTGDQGMVLDPDVNNFHTEDQNIVPPTDSTMPPGASTEPAGALKVSGSTNTPGKVPETNFEYPEPYGLNPPEQGPGFEAPPRPPAKVLFHTASPLVNITDQDIDTAINITTSFGSGTMVGVKGAKALGKVNDLGHAQILEHEGQHPDKILYDTGWYRDVDSRWKFEIDDSKAKFNREWFDKPFVTSRKAGDPIGRNEGLTTAKLSEVLDHPDLYKAHPELKDIKVVKDPRVQTAHWDAANNEIVVGSEKYNTKSTFLHEVQHAIQTLEGFATGAAWGTAGKTYTLKYAEEARKQIVEPLKALYKKLTAQRELGTEEEFKEIDRLQMMAKKYNEYAKAGDAEALERYMNTAGEVEARNAEARMLLNAEERRRMRPAYTADRDNPTLNYVPGIQTPYGFKPYR